MSDATIDAAVVVVAPLLAFWCYCLALDLADWDRGAERAVVCVAGVMGVALLARARPRSRRDLTLPFAIILAALVARHVVAGVLAVRSGATPEIDIGQVTVRAVELVARGRNPFTTSIDAIGDDLQPVGAGLHFFGGFKYGPLMYRAYAPAVAWLGGGGIFATNLAGLLLTAALVGTWTAAGATSSVAGRAAAAMVLLPSFVDRELFVAGVTDIVPVAAAIAAFSLRSRGKATWAGLFLGASFGMKVMPAAVYLLPMLATAGRRMRFIGGCLAAVVLAYAAVLVEAPREVIANVLVFNFVRPADSTSLTFGWPGGLAVAVRVAALAAAAAYGAHQLRSSRDSSPPAAAQRAAISTVLVLLGSGLVHRNYLFWFVPLLAVAASARIFGEAARDPTAA